MSSCTWTERCVTEDAALFARPLEDARFEDVRDFCGTAHHESRDAPLNAWLKDNRCHARSDGQLPRMLRCRCGVVGCVCADQFGGSDLIRPLHGQRAFDQFAFSKSHEAADFGIDLIVSRQILGSFDFASGLGRLGGDIGSQFDEASVAVLHEDGRDFAGRLNRF